MLVYKMVYYGMGQFFESSALEDLQLFCSIYNGSINIIIVEIYELEVCSLGHVDMPYHGDV